MKTRVLLAGALLWSLASWGDPPPAPEPSTPSSTAAHPDDSEDADSALDRVAASKLSPEQLLELLKQREQAKVSMATANGGSRHDRSAVEVIVPVSLFLFLATVVLGALWLGSRKERQRHETLRLMVEKGAPIPTELLVPPVNKNADLRRGIILIAAGIGLTIFFGAVAGQHDKGTWSLGVIPILVGLGYLLSWRLTREPIPQAAGKAQS